MPVDEPKPHHDPARLRCDRAGHAGWSGVVEGEGWLTALICDGAGTWGVGHEIAERTTAAVVAELEGGGPLDVEHLGAGLRVISDALAREWDRDTDTACSALAVCITDERASLTWSGGCLAVLVRGERVIRCTRPHLAGEDSIDAGAARRAAYARPTAWLHTHSLAHPPSRVRALDRTPAPWSIGPDDALVLLSSDAWRNLCDAALLAGLCSPTPAQALVDAASRRGAGPHLSVIVIRRGDDRARHAARRAIADDPGPLLALPRPETSLTWPPPSEAPRRTGPSWYASESSLERDSPWRTVAWSLGERGDDLAAAVIELMQHRDPEFRRATLGSVAPVYRLLAPGRARTRLSPATLDELLRLGLTDSEPTVRADAAGVAFATNRGAAVEELLIAATEHPGTRWQALLALGSGTQPRSLAVLARYLAGDDLAAAGAAVRALAQRPDGRSLWLQGLVDPRPDVHRSALYALSTIVHELSDDELDWLARAELPPDTAQALARRLS